MGESAPQTAGKTEQDRLCLEREEKKKKKKNEVKEAEKGKAHRLSTKSCPQSPVLSVPKTMLSQQGDI